MFLVTSWERKSQKYDKLLNTFVAVFYPWNDIQLLIYVVPWPSLNLPANSLLSHSFFDQENLSLSEISLQLLKLFDALQKQSSIK